MSGRFYPAAPDALRREVQALLDHARASAGTQPAIKSIAAIVPHAGFQYSGPTAAKVLASLALPRLIVVLAPNHTGVCHADGGASLWEAGAFHTPLGDVPVAEAFARALLETEPLVGIDHDAHRAEHAVEVVLPFLQLLEPDAQIVPLVLAWDDWDSCRALGDSLARLVRASGEPVLLVASSDLNHYEPAPASEVKDRRALDAIVALDGSELLRRCRVEHISMCGRAPAATVLAAATTLGAKRAEVVDYRNSGWVSGNAGAVQAVVGYGGVVIA